MNVYSTQQCRRIMIGCIRENTYLLTYTYHLRSIPEGIAETSEIHRDVLILPKDLAMRNTADVTCGKPIAVRLQSISGMSAINP
jgi:hypothetical protein